MHNVLIIGAGQLGSRHLQGVLQSKNALKITVVDPSEEALNIAQERANQVQQGHAETGVAYEKAIPTKQKFEVCIIATPAHVRAAVTQGFLASNIVKHIIFEKVLFQKLAEYEEVAMLLEQHDVQGWVNCPRRLYLTYTTLKGELQNSDPIQMKISGQAWGMACNSIHFIDLFSYLVGEKNLLINKIELDNELLQSKRAGFYEVTGLLQFSIGKNILSIECRKGEGLKLMVEVDSGIRRYLVDEVGGTWTKVVGGKEEQQPHLALYQSQLSGSVIDDLLTIGECGLTDFSESCKLHVPFIDTLLAHISSIFKENLTACPIT